MATAKKKTASRNQACELFADSGEVRFLNGVYRGKAGARWLFPEDPRGTDELLPSVPQTSPHTRVVPFHYAHPVTGETWNEPRTRA